MDFSTEKMIFLKFFICNNTNNDNKSLCFNNTIIFNVFQLIQLFVHYNHNKS